MSRLRNFIAMVAAAAATPAFAQACPAPLAEATRLVLVTAPHMNTSGARLELFQRDSATAAWRSASRNAPVRIGRNGMAWGYSFAAHKKDGEPEKFEGDKRTPAGIFKVGTSFGFDDVQRANYIAVKEGETVCVEDSSSPLYNTITKRSELAPQTKADNMRDTKLFRNGLFVDYPSDRASRRGSCIFIHIWRSPTTGTMGCVAMPEAHVKTLQSFSQSGAVIAILPDTARDRFAGCLPGKE
jgi:L,D-peptidoglycan transpeptidase YkuD (ErfK/YbiS/YcfS/YnhG family)